jgi:hypothetical protein
VTAAQVNTRIMCVGSHALDVDFTGTIKLTDVRQTEVDKVGSVDYRLTLGRMACIRVNLYRKFTQTAQVN